MPRISLRERCQRTCAGCIYRGPYAVPPCGNVLHIDLRRSIPCVYKKLDADAPEPKVEAPRPELASDLKGVHVERAYVQSVWSYVASGEKPGEGNIARNESELKALKTICKSCPDNKYNLGEVKGYSRCSHLGSISWGDNHPCWRWYEIKGWHHQDSKTTTRHPECNGCCHVQFNLCCDFLVGCIAQNKYDNHLEKIPKNKLEEARDFLTRLRDARGDAKPMHNIFKKAEAMTVEEESEIF